MTVVEAELCFFKMQVEGMFLDSIELEQATFCEAPEALDPIDMVRSSNELVVLSGCPGSACRIRDRPVRRSPSSRRGGGWIGLALPRITAWRAALEAFGTTSV